MIEMSGIYALQDRMAASSTPSPLGKIGLTPAQVRAQLLACAPLTREEVKRAAVRAVRKGSCGRRGLPAYAVATMYLDYQQLNSLSRVAALYGRTRQAMWDIFRSHKLPMNPRRFNEKIAYSGRNYTPGKNGYYRATEGDRKQLHHQIWEDNFGPIPAGHQVTFKNADLTDFALDNLACMPIAEVTLHHHRRHQENAA